MSVLLRLQVLRGKKQLLQSLAQMSVLLRLQVLRGEFTGSRVISIRLFLSDR